MFTYYIINVIKYSNRGVSYTNSPDWIKNKKATINPINKKDNECFQYAVTVALNYEKNKKRSSKIKKIKYLRQNITGNKFSFRKR